MIGMVLGLWMSLAAAVEPYQGFNSTGTAIALPTGEEFYDEATDTYYLLFEFQGSPPYSQEHAAFIIKGYRYKDREGYLATIKEAKTHFMITGYLFTMQETSTWIGLTIQCGTPVKYLWEDGANLKEQEFRAWAPNASERSRQNCRGKAGKRLPVFYEKTDLGLRWQVGSERQNSRHILVAFPNPEDQAEDEAEEEQGAEQKPTR